MKSGAYILFLFLWFVTQAFANKPKDIKIIGGFSHPSAIASEGRFIYVANLGKSSDATTKDSDGYISRLTLSGTIIDTNYLPMYNLNAPKGMYVMNEILYITDIDRVIGVNLRNKRKMYELNLKEYSKNLGDITAKDENTFYVAATDADAILEIDLLSGDVKKIESSAPIEKPVSLSPDLFSSNIYVATLGANSKVKGELGKLNVRNGEYDELDLPRNIYTSFHYSPGRYYYLSASSDTSSGCLWTSNLLKKNLVEQVETGPMHYPSDVFVATNGRVWIAVRDDNCIIVLKPDTK